MNEKIVVRSPNIPAQKENIRHWRVPEAVKEDVALFLDELALGKVNKGKKIAEKTQAKYLCVLKVPLEYFNKPTSQLAMSDIEAFERDLTLKVLKSKKHKPYSHSMQVDIRIALRIFLRWKLGKKGTKLTDWFDCRDTVKTPEYLKETEIEKLYKRCKSAQERFLIAVLFDTGARAEEFHNIRFEDIQLPEGTSNFVRIALKEEYSKTAGRTISLYWKHSLEAVKDYLAERMQDRPKAHEPVYAGTYDSGRFLLGRIGQAALGKHVHYHLFRHSSATFFASQLNRQELCIRYGWKFSSNMPDVYIARAGVDSKDLDEKFTQTELSKLKDELVKKDYQDKLKDEQIAKLLAKITTIETNFEEISRIMRLQPSTDDVRNALERKLKLRIL